MWVGAGRSEMRQHARALVCAHARVETRGKVSEHITHDLSLGGARLCGVPHGDVGDDVELSLHLPGGTVTAAGRLVRVGGTGARGEFAIRFGALQEAGEYLIQSAVATAAAQQDARTILSVQPPVNVYTGWSWLSPVSSQCVIATTTLEAITHLRDHAIQIGVVGPALDGAPDWAWRAIYPHATWRCIDTLGRLYTSSPELADAPMLRG